MTLGSAGLSSTDAPAVVLPDLPKLTLSNNRRCFVYTFNIPWALKDGWGKPHESLLYPGLFRGKPRLRSTTSLSIENLLNTTTHRCEPCRDCRLRCHPGGLHHESPTMLYADETCRGIINVVKPWGSASIWEPNVPSDQKPNRVLSCTK